MGTNYYARKKPEDACPHCGSQTTYPDLHIGKSSGGWCFLLRVYPEDEYTPEDERGLPKSLEEWKAYWAQDGVSIVDEYRQEWTVEDMLAQITERTGTRDFSELPLNGRYRYSSWEQYLDAEHRGTAVRGPNGLLRHKLAEVSPYGCIAHGEGTWDLHAGEFS